MRQAPETISELMTCMKYLFSKRTFMVVIAGVIVTTLATAQFEGLLRVRT